MSGLMRSVITLPFSGTPIMKFPTFGLLLRNLLAKIFLRFHTITWPAILLGLNLDLPENIVSHGHILVDGQK